MESIEVRKHAIYLALEYLRGVQLSINSKVEELEEHCRLIDREMGQKGIKEFQ